MPPSFPCASRGVARAQALRAEAARESASAASLEAAFYDQALRRAHGLEDSHAGRTLLAQAHAARECARALLARARSLELTER